MPGDAPRHAMIFAPCMSLQSSLACKCVSPRPVPQTNSQVLSREDFAGGPGDGGGEEDGMRVLATDRYASPFLQAALRAAITLPHSRRVEKREAISISWCSILSCGCPLTV
jgi:hypothetical protein